MPQFQMNVSFADEKRHFQILVAFLAHWEIHLLYLKICGKIQSTIDHPTTYEKYYNDIMIINFEKLLTSWKKNNNFYLLKDPFGE